MASNTPDIVENTEKTRSKVWKHFGFVKNGDKVDKTKTVCKHCFQKLPYQGQTTNMTSHLTRHHYAQYAGAPADADKQKTVVTYFQSQQPYPIQSMRACEISKSIAEYIAIDMKPLSSIDGEGFQLMLKKIDPKYKPVSRRHLLDAYLWPMYHQTKEELLQDLKKARRHAFTTDGWQSLATESYNTFTIHYIDPETTTLISKVLDTQMWSERHTAENLCNLMMDTVTKWNMIDPVCVTDNASNISKAANLTGYPHLGCFAHTMNLAVNRCLDVQEVSALIGRCRKLVSLFKHSAQKSIKLKDAQATLEIKVHQIIIKLI